MFAITRRAKLDPNHRTAKKGCIIFFHYSMLARLKICTARGCLVRIEERDHFSFFGSLYSTVQCSVLSATGIRDTCCEKEIMLLVHPTTFQQLLLQSAPVLVLHQYSSTTKFSLIPYNNPATLMHPLHILYNIFCYAFHRCVPPPMRDARCIRPSDRPSVSAQTT